MPWYNPVSQVVGERAEKSFSNASFTPSVIGHLVANYNHVHDASRVFPRTDDNTPLGVVSISSTTTGWEFGAWVEVAGFDAKTNRADVHFLVVGSISHEDEYIIQLGVGAAGAQVFWGESAFSRDTNHMRASWMSIQGPPIAAGTKLWGRLASASTTLTTVTFKAYTHEYPGVA